MRVKNDYFKLYQVEDIQSDRLLSAFLQLRGSVGVIVHVPREKAIPNPLLYLTLFK